MITYFWIMLYLAFNKPCGVLSQFREIPGHISLKKFGFPPGVYPCGRLDCDSEGLMILSSDGMFNQKITNPAFKKPKTYWAQVEGIVTAEALKRLSEGVMLNDGPTLPAKASLMQEPDLPPRTTPIRFRKTVPTSWSSITIIEGRNRQVRRMFASVGFPVLRLVRYSIGRVNIDEIDQGKFRELTTHEIESLGS